MKSINILGAALLALVATTSCAVHDPFDDNGELGQVLPTVYWEQNSTVVKAGNYGTFTAKYYTSADHRIDHSEVWYMVTRSQSAAATSKLTTSLSYTKTYELADTVRSSQMMATYAHNETMWDGYEYVLTDSFPTSRTLAPMAWNTPSTWDEDRFASYYPSTFASEFCTYMVTQLTKDSTYYNDLRNVYIRYDFTAEQLAELSAKHGLEFPTVTGTDEKSDAWFVDQTVTDHYYYTTVADSVTVYHEIATQDQAPEGVNVFPVYKSAPWVFSRYSDDTGGTINAVRSSWMPFFVELLQSIPFTGWIYDSSNLNYAVSYSRSYFLMPSFRAYDESGKYGETTDNKEISLN